MKHKLQTVRNQISHHAQSAWQTVDSRLHPFPNHLGPVFVQHLDNVMTSQWKSLSELEEAQAKQLQTLINHAYANVPYYTRIFDERGLKPKDINSPKDLEKLPFLTKSLIRENHAELIAKGSEKEFWIESHTSGSTGEPLSFLLDPDHDLRELAFTLRAWSFGSYKPGDPVIQLRSFVPKPGAPVHYHDKRNNFHYLSAYNMTPENMALYVKIINKSGSTVLRGYPSSLYIFAKYLLENNVSIPKIDTIISSSEMLLPQYRETITKALNSPVLDWYGCNERVITVQQCPVNQGYHTNIDYGVLEIVDPQGKVIEVGEGAIVGTNLHNLVMPLIRYRPDDMATRQKKQTCSCGRGLPLEITQISGRSDEILAFGEMMIPPINFYTLFHSIPGIVQFQLVQHNTQELEVKLVTDPKFTAAAEKTVLDGLHERIGNQVKLDLQIVDSIARDPKTGKVKCIVNHTDRK